MRYISHLDLMRLFNRAARRADFDLYLTKGFNPHPVVRIKDALKLGLTGKDQIGEFVLTERLEKEEFKDRLNSQLPSGIGIEKVEVR
ncbi:MAG: DUF2344 domain-containing protein [Candidatus Omnitrophica bacterium]|nr:DUF2344 domain-containing protein [Candidatus Omnitrophota bacterium]